MSPFNAQMDISIIPSSTTLGEQGNGSNMPNSFMSMMRPFISPHFKPMQELMNFIVTHINSKIHHPFNDKPFTIAPVTIENLTYSTMVGKINIQSKHCASIIIYIIAAEAKIKVVIHNDSHNICHMCYSFGEFNFMSQIMIKNGKRVLQNLDFLTVPDM